MRIHSIHWDKVPAFDWAPAPGGSFEIWPAPIDADACFEAAGFTDFADSDDAWDADFTALNARVIDTLARIAGQSRLVEVPLPVWLRPLWALAWLGEQSDTPY